MKGEEAIVVLSGGQDSTVCLAWAAKKFSKVEAVSFDYSQRHNNEIHSAKLIVNEIGRMNSIKINHTIIDADILNKLTYNALTRPELLPKSGENGQLPNTFVDGRNMLFLLLTAILAKQKDIKHIVAGVCQTDFSGYPDCRDIFIKSMNVTLNLAMDYDFVIHTPLMWLNKEETWALADELGVFDLVRYYTVTCYNGIIAEGCGDCPACKLRKRGLDIYLKRRELTF